MRTDYEDENEPMETAPTETLTIADLESRARRCRVDVLYERGTPRPLQTDTVDLVDGREIYRPDGTYIGRCEVW